MQKNEQNSLETIGFGSVSTILIIMIWLGVAECLNTTNTLLARGYVAITTMLCTYLCKSQLESFVSGLAQMFKRTR